VDLEQEGRPSIHAATDLKGHDRTVSDNAIDDELVGEVLAISSPLSSTGMRSRWLTNVHADEGLLRRSDTLTHRGFCHLTSVFPSLSTCYQ
jgi:hypothetical protein